MQHEPDLDQLRTLTVKQLEQRWLDAGCRGEPPHFKHALIQGISWHTQEHSRTGLDTETRRLLKAAIRSAPLPGRKRKYTKRKSRERPTLRSSTTLVRKWGGTTHEVRVLGDKRFRYRDTEYASLSEIAREITGARWSGPRFFGLSKAKS